MIESAESLPRFTISNWELLCIYCHDEEHTKFEHFVRYGSTKDTEVKPATYNPFADLKAKMEENN